MEKHCPSDKMKCPKCFELGHDIVLHSLTDRTKQNDVIRLFGYAPFAHFLTDSGAVSSHGGSGGLGGQGGTGGQGGLGGRIR